MQNKKNVVVKQNCHSRKFLSGIFHVPSRYVPQGKTLYINNQHVEDPRLQSSGMTPLYNNGGFTLIELLVVVLIIGILAAVALPQYQKAVYKSRAVEALTMLNAITQAQEVYYLANGEYTDDISKLDVNVPEELISTNPIEGLFEDRYSYACTAQKWCVASVNNANMPFFQMNFAHRPEIWTASKKFCHVYGYPNDKNDTAKSICQSMGTLDTSVDGDWFNGKYFRLN